MRTAEQRIERAHYQIMRHPSFCTLSGLLYIGKMEIRDNIPTACVNAAGDTFYGRKFIDEMPMEGNKDVYVHYVVLHETGHKALCHLTMWKALFKENHRLANIAADHVVNNMIEESDPQGQFAKMPVGKDGKRIGFCDPKYRGWTTKQVFEDLKKNPPEEQGSGGGGGGTGNGEVMDDHDLTGGDGQPLTEEQAKALEQAIDQALRQGSYLAGKLGGNAKRLVGQLLEPQIKWEDELAAFIQDVCQGSDDATWRRPYRRFLGEDIYLPSYQTESVGELLFAIDVSGSVGNKEMDACLSEVVQAARVARPSKLHLWYWDDGIRAREEYTPDQYDDIVRLTRPKGGGGTNVAEVAIEAQKLPELQAAIILTDGYLGGGWGEWGALPTLWVMTTSVLSEVGKSLKIDV